MYAFNSAAIFPPGRPTTVLSDYAPYYIVYKAGTPSHTKRRCGLSIALKMDVIRGWEKFFVEIQSFWRLAIGSLMVQAKIIVMSWNN